MALAKKTTITEVKPSIEEKKPVERLSNMEGGGTTVRHRQQDRGDYKEQPQHSNGNPKPKKPQTDICFQRCCIIFVASAFVILGLGYYLHVNGTFISVAGDTEKVILHSRDNQELDQVVSDKEAKQEKFATDTKQTPQPSRNKQESDKVDLNKENVQKNDSSKPCEKLKSHDERSILILNDEWSTTKGGVSSFHRHVSILAKQTGVEVYVTALTATYEDLNDAKAKGINLIVAEKKGEHPNMNWLSTYRYAHFPTLCAIQKINVIIGHIPITGEEAIKLKSDCYHDAKVFLFLHVIPEDTLMHKEGWNPRQLEEEATKIQKQAENSSAVFSVGPKIYNHYDADFKSASVDHRKYLPLPEEEYFHVNLITPEKHHNRKVLTVGRVKGVGNLKGYESWLRH
ncbi:uncharacterized protein LOC102807017 isoform X2 [Saccoglossus kowalevskii]